MVHEIHMMNSGGFLYLFDFNSPKADATAVPCENFADYGTERFGPHGLSLLQQDGKFGCITQTPPMVRLVNLLAGMTVFNG